MVALNKAPGEPTLGQMARERVAAEIENVQRHPAVAAVLQQFPDAEITSVRPLQKTPKDDTGTG
jgi:DNA polymerase III subunit gamma/tau